MSLARAGGAPLQSTGPAFEGRLKRAEQARAQFVFLFVHGTQAFFGVTAYGRFDLRPADGVAQRQVVVLAHQGEDDGSEIVLEGESRQEALPEALLAGKQRTNGDLEPSRLRSLSRVVDAGQPPQTRVGDLVDQPYAVYAAQVFARQVAQEARDALFGAAREFGAREVFDLDHQAGL